MSTEPFPVGSPGITSPAHSISWLSYFQSLQECFVVTSQMSQCKGGLCLSSSAAVWIFWPHPNLFGDSGWKMSVFFKKAVPTSAQPPCCFTDVTVKHLKMTEARNSVSLKSLQIVNELQGSAGVHQITWEVVFFYACHRSQSFNSSR